MYTLYLYKEVSCPTNSRHPYQSIAFHNRDKEEITYFMWEEVPYTSVCCTVANSNYKLLPVKRI